MSQPTWKPTLLLYVLLWWTSVTFVSAWLPVVRGAFDGDTYRWGASYFGYLFSGSGVGGDYWFVLVKLALGLAILVLGWRGARFAFPYLLLGWQMFGFSSALHAAVTNPEEFRFRGDTLGIDVSLTWVAPAFYGIALALAIWWFIEDRRERLDGDPKWAAGNYRWLAVLAAFVPIQFALLHYGSPNSANDRIGVLLTILQWLLLPLALKIRGGSTHLAGLPPDDRMTATS
jgi:hypothetical protein